MEAYCTAIYSFSRPSPLSGGWEERLEVPNSQPCLDFLMTNSHPGAYQESLYRTKDPLITQEIPWI